MTSPVFLVAPGDDLADRIARRLLERHGAARPDWSGITLLVPAAAAIAPLRRALLARAGPLLGPDIRTPAGFAEARGGGEPPLGALECRLLLTAALRRHRGLLPEVDRGRAAAALFELFEELTASAVDPGADEAAFTARLQQAYGARENPWLSREAQVVQRLWQAFTEDTGARSPAATYRRRLAAALASLGGDEAAYFCGLDDVDAGEAAAIAVALRSGRAELWLQGRLEGHDGAALRALCTAIGVAPQPVAAATDARGTLLDAAYAEAPAPAIVADGPGLRLLEAAGPEHEARCVELAVRQALLDGAGQVAVIAGDRRLARRLRALLERAGITLEDRAGWALSTSSAAATLDAWLQCLDSGFQFRPLLELLKSGFMEPPPAALEELERGLIYGRPAIEGGLPEFIAGARSQALQDLLRSLQRAAVSLPRGTAPATRWMELLLGSLRALPAWEALLADPAGARLAGVLGELDAACRGVSLSLDWPQFRELLDRAIEGETFVPEARGGPVRLVTLAQAQFERPDLLVLAGATREQLPGSGGAAPFFNASVRRELGLPDWAARRALALSRLRRALQSAPRVLVTWAPASLDEPAQPSPWLEAVEACCAADLREHALPLLAASAAAEVSLPEGTAPARRRPAPPAPAALLPATLSSGAHQALVDCPYQFFARAMLGLRSEHAPDEDPDRSDYGQRVHAILEAFTRPVEGLPPPFEGAVMADNREQARERLRAIAAAVFARDLQRRALARLWSAEFESALPRLLDWLAARPPLRAVEAEVELNREFAGVELSGRADRIEVRADGRRALVDYKTGRLPRQEDVDAGEAVQLLHYALLDPAVGAVEYLALREGQRGFGRDRELARLRASAGARLDRALRELRAAAPLPAHGHEKVCERCDYRAVCRLEDWVE
jgi:ATP-dependent helicase/nuclease subunit B